MPGPAVTRRQLLIGLSAALVLLQAGTAVPPAEAASSPGPLTRDTLEAFADTIVPGQKRFPGDQVVAGAAPGPGAVQAGAIAVLTMPELPLGPLLPGLAAGLNAAATAYAAAHLLLLDPALPPFVALPFRHRTALAAQLLGPGAGDRLWTLLAAIASLAFDTAASLHTADAAGHHPGLVYLRFPLPGADGFWRFPEFSYRRDLAKPHPGTTPSGSPA